MKITITFDSLEEFKKHIIGVPEAAPAQKAPEAPQSDEEPKPKKNPKKAEKPQEEDAGQPDEAPAPEVSEDFRVEVRKTLAKLNKKTLASLTRFLRRKKLRRSPKTSAWRSARPWQSSTRRSARTWPAT